MSALDPLDVVTGALLGCAVGDALGLPAEGMKSAAIARRFGALDRYRLIGGMGFVSDDTEQTALVAESLAVARDDEARAVRHFRRRLVGWFWRLPFGIGLATLRACFKLMLGLKNSGIRSAGNGAAMRASIVGVVVGDAAQRRALGRAIARVTHTDDRAVEGALYVAELAAGAARGVIDVNGALDVVSEPTLRAAITKAIELARARTGDEEAARTLGTTGFVMHTVPLATFMVVKYGDDTLDAVRATIRVGGDTDSNAAIVGTVLGALHGAHALPDELVARLNDGPFGPTHLRALASSLVNGGAPPSWSFLIALVRNLALYPVVLAHGFRRLIPF
jgi:ADP-ribosyl-[dinitrogen reductase] hydrolase